MSKTKKALVMVLSFILVICLTVAVTVAYLTDKTDNVKNTFTMGKVNIKLDEAVVDETGTATDARTEEGNTDNYDGEYGYLLMPGQSVDKDPTVTVLKGSEECYVRVKVTLSNATTFAKIYKAQFAGTGNDVEAAIAAMKAYFVGYDESVWEFADSELNGTDLTVTFNYYQTVEKDTANDTELEPLITGLTVPEWVTSDMAAELPNFEVTIIAEAIQAAGFETAEAAWTAFDAQA